MRESTFEQDGVSLFNNFDARPERRSKRLRLTNDHELYRLFYEGSIEPFGFEKDTKAEVLNRANKLRVSASKVFLGYVGNGKEKPLAKFRYEVDEFENWLEQHLGESQKRELIRAMARRNLLKLGLPKHLSERRFELGLSGREIGDILEELAPIAKRHAEEVNRFCVGKLGELPWGYIKQDALAQIQFLPLLPINLLVSRIENQDPSQKRNQVGIQKHKIDLATDDWIFEGPVFKYREDGRISLGRFAKPFPRQQTPLNIIYGSAGFDLTATQSRVVQTCMIDVYERRGFVQPPDKNQMRTALLAFEEAKWELAKSKLLPQQLAPLKTHVRIHACFTLGPRLVNDNLEQSGDGSKLFDESLVKTRVELREFAKRVEKKFLDEMVVIVNNRLNGVPPLQRNDFCLPDAHCYESLVISVLEAQADDQ